MAGMLYARRGAGLTLGELGQQIDGGHRPFWVGESRSVYGYESVWTCTRTFLLERSKGRFYPSAILTACALVGYRQSFRA